MAKHTIVLIPGDGIGPEVTNATKRVIEAAGLSVDWVELPAGEVAVVAAGQQRGGREHRGADQSCVHRNRAVPAARNSTAMSASAPTL